MQDSKWKLVLKNYVKNNYKEYILTSLIFIIGLFIGVMIINNSTETQSSEITTYLNEFITKFKGIQNINKTSLIFTSIKNNIILAVIIWAAGTTVIGLPIVLIAILLRGLILGYTISAVTLTLGASKGIIFCLISIFLQNILFIPAVLTLGVSSIKLYKSIMKDKRRENIKVEIIRHTIISAIMILVLVISSLIENVISITLLKSFIKYFKKNSKKLFTILE
ncbi:MAG: stage II sporulation protein M [Clostridia bacterium]|nr:stage II sporulation protein M [Clostridia bacterium]